METKILSELVDQEYRDRFETNLLRIIEQCVGTFIFHSDDDDVCLTNVCTTVCLKDKFNPIVQCKPTFINPVNSIRVSFKELDQLTSFGIVGFKEESLKYQALWSPQFKCLCEYNFITKQHSRTVVNHSYVPDDLTIYCEYNSISNSINFRFNTDSFVLQLSEKPQQKLKFSFAIEIGPATTCSIKY